MNMEHIEQTLSEVADRLVDAVLEGEDKGSETLRILKRQTAKVELTGLQLVTLAGILRDNRSKATDFKPSLFKNKKSPNLLASMILSTAMPKIMTALKDIPAYVDFKTL